MGDLEESILKQNVPGRIVPGLKKMTINVVAIPTMTMTIMASITIKMTTAESLA
jgi:hypothetical protein